MDAVVWGILMLTFTTLTLESGELRDYCLHEAFNVTCAAGEVILIGQARYGRMRPGRCISSEYGNIGCWADVVGQLDVTCSGRRSCAVSVRTFVDVQPCRKDFSSYLETSYTCVKVPVFEVTNSCPSTGSFPLSTSSGYLPGWTSPGSPVGTAACPWRVQVPAGQRVNITLYHLKGSVDVKQTARKGRPRACLLTLVIEDGEQTEVVDTCRATERKWTIFTSTTSELLVHLVKAATGRLQNTDLLIQYDAIGCANPPLPAGASMSRRGKDLVVRCNGSKETWYLTCDGGSWIGSLGNCSHLVPARPRSVAHSSTAMPHGIIFAVTIGTLLGVAIGTTLLCVIRCIQKRRKDDNIRSDTLILAPAYGVNHSSTLGKRTMAPCVSRPNAEQCYNIRPSSSIEDCCEEDSGPRTDQPLVTLPGYSTNTAKRKHLYESPLCSHGAHGSPGRMSVYYELAVNAN